VFLVTVLPTTYGVVMIFAVLETIPSAGGFVDLLQPQLNASRSSTSISTSRVALSHTIPDGSYVHDTASLPITSNHVTVHDQPIRAELFYSHSLPNRYKSN